MAQQHGVEIKAYHTYSGIFQDQEWVNSCTKQSKALTFAGVNANHGNNIEEKHIRHIQDLTITQLIYAENICITPITVNLWTYAIRMENGSTNNKPRFHDLQKRTLHQLFTRTELNTNPEHWIPFECPLFALETEYANNNKGLIYNWEKFPSTHVMFQWYSTL